MSSQDLSSHYQSSSQPQWPPAERSRSSSQPSQAQQSSSQSRTSRFSWVPPTDDDAAMEQVLEIRREIDRLQALERGISKSRKSFTLSDDGNHNSGRTSLTAGSDASSPELQEHIAKLKRRVERLKGWEEYIKSSGSFRLPEDEEIQMARKESSLKKGIAAVIGLLILLAVIAIVASTIKMMRKRGITFSNSYSAANGNVSSSVITMKEVALHNTSSNCWLVLHGGVYDLTDYANRHPGGPTWITSLAGTDGSASFDSFHPLSLLRTAAKYQVGVLGGGATSAPGTGASVGSTNSIISNQSSTGSANSGAASSNSSCGQGCVTYAELALHNTASDLWVAYYGTVYDLTSYQYQHPGGQSNILGNAGADGTSAFQRVHNQNVLSIVQGNIVGTLQTTSDTPPTSTTTSPVGVTTTSPTLPVPYTSSPATSSNPPGTSTNPPSSPDAPSCGAGCITYSELALHNTASDLWVAYYGTVYNLTSYQYQHPGGQNNILGSAGADGTSAFQRVHNQNVLSIVQSNIVGTLQTTSKTPPPSSPTSAPVSALTTSPTSPVPYVPPVAPTILPVTSTSTPTAPTNPPGVSTSLPLAPTNPPVTPTIAPAVATNPPTSPSTPSCGQGCITYAELALHNSANDLWVAFYGTVYDLTSYQYQHPGGQYNIASNGGADGTSAFQRVHNQNVLSIVQSNIIGTLQTTPYTPPTQAPTNPPVPAPTSPPSPAPYTAPVPAPTNPTFVVSPVAPTNYPVAPTNVPVTPSIPPVTPTNSPMAPTNPPCGQGCVTSAELSLHNSANDLWVAFYGTVYDLTSYQYQHPGGQSRILGNAGADGTSAFQRVHNQNVLSIVQSNIVGKLQGF